YKGYGYGCVAPEGEAFVPWNAVKKYPYSYIGTGNRQKVAEGFFDQGKISDGVWDFFYLYRLKSDVNLQPILLVPAKQFQDFLEVINRSLSTSLAMPSGGKNGAFMVSFENDGTPRPRYLGRTTNEEAAETLRNNIPPTYYKPKNEPASTVTPTEQALAAFKAKLELMNAAQKGKKNANKEKSRKERVFNQQSWKDSLKRTQRYLGLREASGKKYLPRGTEKYGLPWNKIDEIKAAGVTEAPALSFTPDILAPYPREGRVVFVCVDVEAYERNNNLITEIGIATLDTDDLEGVVPGEGGANWMKLIRARHFRINEHKHLNNTEFVHGCADRFEYGESEFISLKDAPRVVASCFKHPFSKIGGDDTEPEQKRSIILVGHDLGMDINYLKKLGYDVYNLSNLLECVDSANMWKYMTRDNNPRKLAMILAELRLIGWNLHNAGNDAVYTLWAIIGISCKHLKEYAEKAESKEAEKQKRIRESVAEAEQKAAEREEGWSSEGSDGGGPVAPVSPEPKVNVSSRPTHSDARKENTAPRGNYPGYRHGNNTGGSSTNKVVNSWLSGTQKSKTNISPKAPELNVKPRKNQDLVGGTSQAGVGNQKNSVKKPTPHEFNPRADDPTTQRALESLTAKINESTPRQQNKQSTFLPDAPATPDPRWKTGRPPSPGLIEAFSKGRLESEGGGGVSLGSSKAKRKGLSLAKEKNFELSLD
ncbi:Uncharacterized protein LSUE1_G009553, partial [Lachnellula suecica]